MKKYWHELTEEEQTLIRMEGIPYTSLLENYKQPDWCSFPNALMGDMGCWSLMRIYSNSPPITEKFCMTCPVYEGKWKWLGKILYKWRRAVANIRYNINPTF